MKKFMMLLLLSTIVIISACSNDSDDGSKSGDNEKVKETEKANKEEDKGEKKKIYHVGDTAKITSSTYEFPYEVTLNSFKLTTEPVDGVKLEDKILEVSENDRFAVANVTIRNTSNPPFVPNDKISAQLMIGDMAVNSEDVDFFTDREKKLEPGKEITGNLVYVSSYFYDEDVLYLTYELRANTEETKFELPVSK